mgnify:FL=1
MAEWLREAEGEKTRVMRREGNYHRGRLVGRSTLIRSRSRSCRSRLR